MTSLRRTWLLCLLPLLVLVASRTARAQTAAPASAVAAPTLSIESPTAGQVVPGVAIIRFRTENVSITSLFVPPAQQRNAIPAHLHVSVDGAAWHWVHSTSDPIVITPLPAGEHTVTLELAGADHRPLDTRSVRFTVIAKPSPATDHPAHNAAPTSAAEPSVATPARWELRLPSGALVSTGAQRHIIKDAQLSAVQLSYIVRPRLAVTGMVGWARSRDVASAGDPKVDVFSYDVGAEVRGSQWLVGEHLTLSPFLGAGAGARSYNYRGLAFDATHNAAAYGTIGGEAGVGRVRVRLEVRDYIAGFKPLDGTGASSTHNDVVATLAVGFVRRTPPTQR
jgi:hypothetical protein